MTMNKEYYLANEEFVINDYDLKKTFSSFLPGLAGKKGIPLWAFYVNRGQGLCSFGVENKDNPILEFSPAVTAYQNVDRIGFRTFVKLNNDVCMSFLVLSVLKIPSVKCTSSVINLRLLKKIEILIY